MQPLDQELSIFSELCCQAELVTGHFCACIFPWPLEQPPRCSGYSGWQGTWGLFSAKVESYLGAMMSSAFSYYFLKAKDLWLSVEVCRLNIDGHKSRQEEKCGLLAASGWTLNQQPKQYRFINHGGFLALRTEGF